MKLTPLLQALRAAVQQGDRPTALELVRQIQQQLATQAANHTALERQVRALLAELDGIPPARPPADWNFDPHAERGDWEEHNDLVEFSDSGECCDHEEVDGNFNRHCERGDREGCIDLVEYRDPEERCDHEEVDGNFNRHCERGDWEGCIDLVEYRDPEERCDLEACGNVDKMPDNTSATQLNESSTKKDDERLFSVWFGTNRRATKDGRGFTGERDAHTTVGQVEVSVPEAHHFGETGSSFWTKLKRRDFRNDRLRLRAVKVKDTDDFYASLQATMQKDGASHALFFLHGFNVSFEEAAIRAAQLGCDLAVPGATAFFSWPSRGAVTAYPADEASIEASERAITDFLVEFAARSGAQKIHVIAHSMGNRGLLRALQRIAANAETRGKVKFGQIFLAAPDVDRDLFLDLARLYPEHSERTTLYASKADLPVHLSSKVHSAPRAGYFKPYTVVPGVDTVAVPDFDLDLLGHSYFAQAEALLHDMFDLMRQDAPPARRQRMSAATEEGQGFWKLLL